MKSYRLAVAYLIPLRNPFRFVHAIGLALHQFASDATNGAGELRPGAPSGCTGRQLDSACTGAATPTREVNTGGVPSGPQALPIGAKKHDDWQMRDVQILVQYISSVPLDSRLCASRALKELGWADLPDPKHEIWLRVRNKLRRLQFSLRHGHDPFEGGHGGHRDKAYNWREWLPRVFERLPNGEGTVPEVAALIESDPEIAPLLDRRPNPFTSATPRWRTNLEKTVYGSPEFVKTGNYRDGCNVYRYDEEDIARAMQDARPPKVPKHNVPYMGKDNK